MYQMLRKGEWQIADTCPKLTEALPSRIHDDNGPRWQRIHFMT